MLVTGTIACPMCMQRVTSLQFWKKVGESYFHLCTDCCVKPKSEDDLLRIGLVTGFQEGIDKASNAVKEEAKKFISENGNEKEKDCRCIASSPDNIYLGGLNMTGKPSRGVYCRCTTCGGRLYSV